MTAGCSGSSSAASTSRRFVISVRSRIIWIIFGSTPAPTRCPLNMENPNIKLIRQQSGRPYAGKVFAAVHAHSSDVPQYAGGLCAKLIVEGYTGYLIRTTNDEKSGGGTIAQNILSNEQENLKMAAAVGFKDVFDLYYRSHFMDGIA